MGKTAAGGKGTGSQTDPVLLPGPRKPCWGCRCGFDDNWACRLRCQRCDRPAPQRYSDAARAAAKTWHVRPQQRGGGTTQRGPQQRGGGTTQRGGVAPKSYADAVRQFLPSAAAAGQSQGPNGDQSMRPAETVSQDAATLTSQQKQLRYWRERRAAAVRAEADSDIQDCDQQIRALEQAAKAARPWDVRVQAATDAQRAAAAKLDSVQADLDGARHAVTHFESEVRQAQAALADADAALAGVRAEGAPARAAAERSAPELTDAGIRAALDLLAAAGAALLPPGGAGGAGAGAGAGGAGAGAGAAALVEQLRGALNTAATAQCGAGAAGHAGDAAVDQAGLAVSPPAVAALAPADSPIVPAVPSASAGNDSAASGSAAAELPGGGAAALSLAEAAAAVPNAPAATGPQQNLVQMFKGQGKGKTDREVPYG